MNACVPLCVAVVLLAAPAAAQTGGGAPAPSVEDLKAPSAPAATLLDVSPTAIERPDAPGALVLNVIAHIIKDEGVPRNFAVQVAPYWMQWHPRLTFDSYVNPGVLRQIVRSFAVSFASADWTIGEGRTREDVGSRIGVGFSAVPYQGRVDRQVVRLRDQAIETTKLIGRELRLAESADAELKRYRRDAAAAVARESDPERIVQRSRELADADAALAARAAERDQKLSALEQRSRRLATSIQQLDTERYGARLALAAARTWGIPGDVLGEARGERTAIWITPSYRLRLVRQAASGAPADREGAGDRGGGEDDAIPEAVESGAIELVGVVRYLRDRSGTDGQEDAVDLGGRIVWQIRGEIAVSAEVVRRAWRGALSDTFRAAGIFEAKLSENAHFFAAFGRDYEERRTRSTLLSMIGVNLGFGRKPALIF